MKLKTTGIAKPMEAEYATDVIDKEIEGLKALYPVVKSDAFNKAVALLFDTKGKVILSGMGKSGHVARKIAATFASTGTSSFFVHPGEASHGDLGMIAAEDTLLLLSNSGETAELKDLIDYAKRHSIKLIGIVRRQTSALVDAADVAIVLPAVPEALIAGAPSTSTTMMMALGDSMAAALMHQKGFSEEEFGTLHPGGKLGSKFIKVTDIMHKGKSLPLVSQDMPMTEVIPLITEKSLGCAIVIDASGKLLGIITDGDLRRHLTDATLAKNAAQLMTTNPTTIRPTALVSEALAIMNTKKITSLLIVEDNKPIGLVHIHDALKV